MISIVWRNVVDDWEKVWSLYPRKVAKHPARQQWARMTAEDQFAALHSLPVHIKYWEAAGWSAEFVPHLRTWLYQRRWEDELEMPKAEDGWWKSQTGIEAKARELGMWPPPAREGWHELKARILAKTRAA